MLQTLSKTGAGTRQPGHYGSTGNARDFRNFVVGEFFHFTQDDSFPKIRRQQFDTSCHCRRPLVAD